MLDVVDAVGQRPLVERDDAASHVVGGQAGVAEHHADDGNVDIRKDVGRRPQRRRGTKNQDQHSHDDERIGPPQGEPYDSNHELLPCKR